MKIRKRKNSEIGKKKHVVVLSQFYKPEPNIFPPQIAEALKNEGNRVSVVTGYPNRPGGKIYDGYSQKLRYSEVIDGITVHRVPLIINYSRSAVERIFNFLTFAASALTATSKIKDADAVYVYATPATAAIPAQVWKLIFGIPYVLHVQDIWPESVTDSGMVGKGKLNTLAERLLSIWLKRLYGNADALIAISPGMRDLLIDRGNQAERCVVVYNWAAESSIIIKDETDFSDSQLNLLYAGNLGPMQDLETVVEAAHQIETGVPFSLKFAGGGISENGLRELSQGSANIEFLGRLSREDVAQLYLEADFQLVTLKDIPIFRTTVPSKLQASLAAGVPVITTVKGDVAKLIEEHGAGLVAEPGNVASLQEAMKRALAMSSKERAEMGKRARLLYESKMSHFSGTSAINSVLKHVIDGTGNQ